MSSIKNTFTDLVRILMIPLSLIYYGAGLLLLAVCYPFLLFVFWIKRYRSYTRTQRKIAGFRELRAGWLYGEGEAFDEEILETALSLHDFAAASGFTATDAFPGPDGEVMYTVYSGKHCLEFTIIPPSGSIDFRHEREGVEAESEEGLSLHDALKHLCNEELKKRTWRLL